MPYLKDRYICGLLFLLLVLIFPYQLHSQNKIKYDSLYIKSIQDSVDRYYRMHPWKKPTKKYESKFLPYYGVNYSQEMEFGASIGAMCFYKNKKDTTDNYSGSAIISNLSTNLSYSFIVTGIHNISNTLYLKYRIDYRNMARFFWGLGYKNGDNDSNKSKYLEQKANIELKIGYKCGNIYLSSSLAYTYFKSSDFTDKFKEDLLSGITYSPNIGITFTYNTRDNDNSPKKGIYLNLGQFFFLPILSSNKIYYRSNLTFNFYQKAWWGSVLAFDVYSESNYGDSPWNEWYLLGGDTRMRGYYLGRYRDKNILSAQIELRQKIYKQHSAILYAGAGNIFNSYKKINIKNTLPTYGTGYQYSFYNLILRLDIGFGKKNQFSIIAGLNQSF